MDRPSGYRRWMSTREPTVESRELIAHGKKFDFERLRVRRPSGATLEREVVRHPGAVVVVPVLVHHGRLSVVLIRNYRISIGAWLLECCAGTIERPRREPDAFGAPRGFGAGESPETCAARELIEETGYAAGRLEPVSPGWFYTTPGMTDEQMFVFLARDLRSVGQRLEDDESIEVVIRPLEHMPDAIACGEMRDAKSMLAILLAMRALGGTPQA